MTLEVRDLEVRFHTGYGVVHAVRGVSFDVREGETLGIVGESGCGKSVTALSVLRLIEPPGTISGSVKFAGRDLIGMSGEEIRQLRGGDISMIFQDPMTSLNPVLTIGGQLGDVMRAHGISDATQRRARMLELLDAVGIPSPAELIRAYPHECSGGMRQRIMIAMALANRPSVILADEPSTALDVTVQAQILELLAGLNREYGTAIVLISHDLGVISEFCERILVFYAGKIVEEGPVDAVFRDPKHPYTRALLRSIPRHVAGGREALQVIPGRPPTLSPPPVGCAFAPRCDFRFDRCSEDPPLLGVGADDRRRAACWLVVEASAEPGEGNLR